MGQKVNPVGFRILLGGVWDSVWCKKKENFADCLVKDIKIRNFIFQKYRNAFISKVIIERIEKKINVIIKASKVGLLIGKKGSDIEKIKLQLQKEFGETDINVKVVEVDKPDIDAQVIATSIAKQVENRASYKKVIKKAIQFAMRSNVKGIKIKIGGRLNGVEIARSETYKEGSVPLHTLKSDILYATAEASTVYGIIGIKVWVCKK